MWGEITSCQLFKELRTFVSLSCFRILTPGPPISRSQGLPSNDGMSLGYLVSGVQGSPKRGKIPAVILDLLQGPETSTMYFFLNCALTLLTDAYSILSNPAGLLCAMESQHLLAPTCTESENSFNAPSILLVGTMHSFRCCYLTFTCKVLFEHLK